MVLPCYLFVLHWTPGTHSDQAGTTHRHAPSPFPHFIPQHAPNPHTHPCFSLKALRRRPRPSPVCFVDASGMWGSSGPRKRDLSASSRAAGEMPTRRFNLDDGSGDRAEDSVNQATRNSRFHQYLKHEQHKKVTTSRTDACRQHCSSECW